MATFAHDVRIAPSCAGVVQKRKHGILSFIEWNRWANLAWWWYSSSVGKLNKVLTTLSVIQQAQIVLIYRQLAVFLFLWNCDGSSSASCWCADILGDSPNITTSGSGNAVTISLSNSPSVSVGCWTAGTTVAGTANNREQRSLQVMV